MVLAFASLVDSWWGLLPAVPIWVLSERLVGRYFDLRAERFLRR